MARTDFIDDDLIQKRDAVREVKFGPTADAEAERVPSSGGVVQVQELNLTPLAQKQKEINHQLVERLDELERLRARQAALEKERHALEQLRHNQEKYESGKRELIEQLEQYLIYLEREEVRLNQHLALLTETDSAFKEMLEMVRGVDESKWPEDSEGFRDELHRALAMVENSRKEFNKALAKIEALREDKSMPLPARPVPVSAAGAPRSFLDWLLIGLALSLPLVVVLLAIGGYVIVRWGY